MLYWSRLHVILRPAVTAVCLLALMGCWSAKQSIDSGAREVKGLSDNSEERFVSIEELATSSEARFEQAGDLEGIAEQQEIASEAVSGVDEQRDIQELVEDIRTDLHGVEDTVPWWANLTSTVAIAVIVVVVFLLLWRSGILGFVKTVVWGMGLLVPKKKIQEVKLDLKVLDDDSPATIRESVASKRASDPAYEAAYNKVKGK